MVDVEKLINTRRRKGIACVCRICGRAVMADDVVYIKSKRKDEWFYHLSCWKEEHKK